MALLIGAVSVAVYANTLRNGLHVDDQYQIVTNPWIRSLDNLPAIFSSGVWDFDGRVSSYYRPMMYVLYALVHAFAGTSAWAYHLLNVALHAGSAVLVFLIARALLGPGNSRDAWWGGPALLAAMLFAVHPIHTEPVAWAAGVVDLSYTFFSLLAFFLATQGRRHWRYGVTALAAFGAALLSKEPAITLPALLLVYWSLTEGRVLGVKGLARRLLPWVAVSAAYLAVRSVVLGEIAPPSAPLELSPREYVLTATSLLGRFLRAQVFPTELNFWHVFTPVRSPWSLDALLAFLTVGAWAVLLVWALKRRALVPALGLAVMVLPLTPTLLLGSLNQGLENAFAERYVYLPSFGVVLLAGWAVSALQPGQIRLSRALAAGLAILGVLGAAVTVQRNPAWKDSLALWGDAVTKSPESGVANLGYGFALMSAGQNALGQRYVQRSVALAPQLVKREMVRAVSYARSGRATDAILAFHRVLVMDPRSAEARFNLGVLYEERGDTSAAVSEYLASIKLDPRAADAHNNLGILYFTAGYRDQALEHLETAVRLQPQDASYRSNLERARTR